MYDFLIYSLKTAACLAAFYLLYKLLLSRETFHRANRVVLLAAMAASFVLPLCIITVYREAPEPVPTLAPLSVPATALAETGQPFDAEMVRRMIEAGIIDVQASAADTGNATAGVSDAGWGAIAGIAYIAGAAIALLLVALAILRVVGVIRTGVKEPIGRRAILVRKKEDIVPFSWVRYIVVSNRDLAENGAQIISHEKAHVELRHSFDLILADLFCCLQWFNPAVWLLRRELTAIHEYEADRAVLASGADPKEYQMLLIKKAAGTGRYSIANSLNHSKLKNRITMMLQKRSNPGAKAKILLLLPAVCLALTAFAQTEYIPAKGKVTQKNGKTTVPAPVVPDKALRVPDIKAIPDNSEIHLRNAVVVLGEGNELFVENGILKHGGSHEKGDTVKTQAQEIIVYRGSATVKKDAQGEKRVMFVMKPFSDLPSEKKQNNTMHTYRFILDDLPEEFFEIRSFTMDVDALKLDKDMIKIVIDSLEKKKIPAPGDKDSDGDERSGPDVAALYELRRNIERYDIDASQWQKLADSLGAKIKAYSVSGDGFNRGEALELDTKALAELRNGFDSLELDPETLAGLRDMADSIRTSAYFLKFDGNNFGMGDPGAFMADTTIMIVNGKPVELAFGGAVGPVGKNTEVKIIKRGDGRTTMSASKTARRGNLETMHIDIDGRGRVKVEGRSTEVEKLADTVAEIASGAGKTVRDYEYSITVSPKTRVGAVNGVKEQLRGMGVAVKISDPVQ